MYVMVHFLGYHRLVGRLVEIVASAAVFVGVVVFYGELGVVRCPEERAGADGLAVEFGYFGEAVAVVVVAVARAALSVDEGACLIVVGDHRGIDRGVIVERSGRSYEGELMGKRG